MTRNQRRATALHLLRPGVVVVPRAPDRLVVGHDRSRVAVPDSPEAQRLIGRLTTGGGPPPGADDPPETWRLWRRLDDAGLLVTVAALDRSREASRGRAPGGSGPGSAATDAALLAYGDEAAAVLRARVAATTRVHGPDDLRGAAARAMSDAGLPVATGAGSAVVHVVAGDVTPDPDTLADLLRRGAPHLVIVRDTSGVTVGPFVVPGLTACTGCLEAALADRDPEQGMLRLLRTRSLRDRVLPAEPAALGLALAVAARDLVVWAAGDEPSTWSATRTFGHAGGEERVELRRHARCGCAWDALDSDAG